MLILQEYNYLSSPDNSISTPYGLFNNEIWFIWIFDLYFQCSRTALTKVELSGISVLNSMDTIWKKINASFGFFV